MRNSFAQSSFHSAEGLISHSHGHGRGRRDRACRNAFVIGAIVFAVLQYRDALSFSSMFRLRRPFSRDAIPAGDSPWNRLNHLIVVCGHAVLTTHGALTDETALLDESWALETFQRGQVPTFVAHISKGIDIASRDDMSLLLFSGGMTRAGAGPRSESQSYWEVADALRWHGKPAVRERALTEDHAHDSFENVLFSICRCQCHRQRCSHRPSRRTHQSRPHPPRPFLLLLLLLLQVPRSHGSLPGTPDARLV
jgi:hypothetical protein